MFIHIMLLFLQLVTIICLANAKNITIEPKYVNGSEDVHYLEMIVIYGWTGGVKGKSNH